MITKRFTMFGSTVRDNGEDITAWDCCEILNELLEENEELRKDREELFIRERDTKNEWRDLKRENNELRKIGEIVSFIALKSNRDDGKFIENESGQELTEEEAIKIVQDCWRDMPIDYYSWDLEKVVYFDKMFFKELKE